MTGYFQTFFRKIKKPLPSPDLFGYTAASSVTRRRSSVVERILGKAEVGSSILPGGTIEAQT